jgi:carboxymethylenebutenolidase
LTEKTDAPAVTTEFGSASGGFVAVPDGPGPFPVVIVCHERYGLVSHTCDLARRFAAEGIFAVAPDMYHHMSLDLPDGARLPELGDEEVRDHLDAAIDYARARPETDPERIAVMGVCLSGRYPILVDAYRDDLTAGVLLYGGAQSREYEVSKAKPVPYLDMIARGHAPLLGIYGERDHTMSIDDVTRLRAALEHARRNYEFIVFPAMPHGWLNDTMPGRYRPAEAERAWRLIRDFLDRAFTGALSADGTGRVHWSFQSDIATDYDFSKNVRLD